MAPHILIASFKFKYCQIIFIHACHQAHLNIHLYIGNSPYSLIIHGYRYTLISFENILCFYIAILY